MEVEEVFKDLDIAHSGEVLDTNITKKHLNTHCKITYNEVSVHYIL